MRIYTLLFFLCSNFYVIAQDQFNGIVKDRDTGQEMPYVNVGVVNKRVGTVSKENGKFSLLIDFKKISKLDTLQISSVGYKTIKKSVGELNLMNTKYETILMTKDVFELDEVVLTADSQKISQRKVGYYIGKSNKIGYWRGDTSLGAEMVTKIKVTKRKRQLNEFTFAVLKNLSDSLRLRVNVYRGDTSFPIYKINRENIFFTLTKKFGVVSIDLTPFEIYVEDDFSVGLELIDVYGEEINFTISASDDEGKSYRRYASQDEWHRYRNDALAFTVNTTVLDKDDSITGFGEDELYGENRMSSKPNMVTGFVFNKGYPIENVDIKVEGKAVAASTDENGRYSIEANLGDIVTFNFLDMETVERKVIETTFGINVSMETEVTELDEVTVTERKKVKKTQEKLFLEYNKNPNLIKTGFGILDKTTSAVALYILDESDFRSTSINILEAVSGKFPGVKVADISDPLKTASAYDPNAVLYARGGGSLLNARPMIYEIDGLIVLEVPRYLDMVNVKRIAVLKGLAAVARYGTIAAGGIVVINTKVGNYSPKENGKPIDQLRLKDNLYQEDAITQKQVKKNWPLYLKELNASNSYIEAKEIYEAYSKNFSSSPHFLVDSYVNFKKYWKNETDIDLVISENSMVFEDNLSALASLGYAFEAVGEFQRAELVYKKLFKLRPNHVQSYLDLARNYVALGANNKALRLFLQYNHLLNQEFLHANKEVSHAIILTEFENLTARMGDTIAEKGNNLTDIETEVKLSTRLVFDWNESKADFELQFVNPKNRYFNWSTKPAIDGQNDKETIFSKEFFIDDYMIGDWLVNINYKGAETTDPIYMKVTIFFDYGMPSQRSKVQLFRLHLKDVNQQLFRLSGNPISFTK